MTTSALIQSTAVVAAVPEIQIHTTPLRDSVKNAVEKYFEHLDGQPITGLYDIVLSEIEEPLLQTIMQITQGNQSLTARVLGLSRGTLRKKLEQYGML